MKLANLLEETSPLHVGQAIYSPYGYGTIDHIDDFWVTFKSWSTPTKFRRVSKDEVETDLTKPIQNSLGISDFKDKKLVLDILERKTSQFQALVMSFLREKFPMHWPWIEREAKLRGIHIEK